jgi:hypothetical protein
MGSKPESRQTSILRPVLLALALLAISVPALALPRYAAEYGQSCTLCHENPTGGGLRTDYATHYLIPEEIAARGWPAYEGDGLLAQPGAALTPNVTIGADLRTLAWQREGGDGDVFAMQGDLYLNLRLSPTASAYIEQGISGSGEIFALLRTLPLDGYLKAGRFIPDYGWRFADHQMFNRRYLVDGAGSDSPSFLYDSGLEAAVSPGRLELSGSVLSGREGHGDNYAGRVFLRHEVGGLRLGLGASVLRQHDSRGHRRAVGGIWAVNAGPVTWLGEVDETRRPDGPEGQILLGNLVAQEVTVRVARGWDARLTYGFQDPDRANRTGARHRFGAGTAYMPRPYFATQFMVNSWQVDQGPVMTDQDVVEAELMLHFFY